MKIFFQRNKTKWYEIDIIKNGGVWDKAIIKNISNKTIDDVIYINDNLLKSFFLIDERYFKFYIFNVFLDLGEKKLDIGKLKSVIQKKKNFLRNVVGEKKKLLYVLIDNVYINGQKCKFVLGKSGKIFFDIIFIYIDDALYDILNKYGQQIFDLGHVWPESFYTVKFLSEKFLKKDFGILYIYDDFVKYIKIENGICKIVDFLEFGYDKLVYFFRERDLLKLFYQYKMGVQLNFIGEKLVKEILDFYFSFIEKRIAEKQVLNTYCVLIGSELFGKICVSNFFRKLQVIPFKYSLYIDKKIKVKNIPIDVKTFLYYKG